MSRLHLTVFGPPQVHHGDQRLTFSTRKELALLIYLALEPQQHQRKKLTDLLWPESDAMRGSAAFRTVLSRLRDTLRETPAQEDAHLEVERTTIGLSRDHITVDLLALDAACLRAKQVSASTVSPGSEELQTATEELVQASLLVRGPFLQDFIVREAPAFEEWTRSQREYWQVRLRLFFDQLAFLQEGMGLREQALESTRRWLAVDPLHEEGYLRLMRLYESLGNRRAALEAYEVYRIDLEHELHALPSPPLTALAERLRRGTPAVQTRPSTNLTAPPAALTLLQTPFIGREQEFSRLVEGYTRMQMKSTAERTQVVLVEGEAGIGKTRLVSEFVTWTEEQGAEVLAGRAFEIGGRLPYQPLIHALRPRLDAENAPEDLLADVWLSALSCLFPELRERYPDLPPPSNEEAGASTQLFEAVARLIEAWARRKPVVLWLDDLHWADVASLDLLVYLIGCWQERNTPVLLLLSLRNEARYSSALLEWKASLSHSTMPIVLQLSSLSINETKQVVLALSGGMKPAVSEQVGGWLYRETAGHPFYLLETLKLLLERQAVRPIYLPEQGWVLDFTGLSGKEHLQQGLLPASVRELIRARMSHLSAQAQAMLLAAAVLDRDSSFESLVEVAGLSETEALAGLDEVLAQRFVMESLREREGHAESVYLFTHDKLREVVYLEASEARRGVFHRRAFGLLQRTAAPAADIAHQARYAGLREACFRYNVQAGNDAMAVFAVQDAITFYERASRARSASRIQKVASPSEYIHLYEQLGRGYELLQKLELAHYAYQLMLSVAQEAGDQERLWRATHHIAILGTGSLLRPEVGRQWIQKRQQTQDSASPPL